MANSRRFEITELFPQPKQVILGEGISELAMDVRLSTSNVLPVQRKALRSILTMAGVRVVANKKKYVVDAQVLDPEAFDLSQVPEGVRKDFYELEIKGSEVFIRTPCQEGMVWAAQTLAILFNMMFKGMAVPNLVLRDWPMVPQRGLMMDLDWGTERMGTSEWFQALDCMSRMHLNLCGIGVYDCRPDVRASQSFQPSEFLLTAIHDEPVSNEPVSTSRFRYYNVKYDRWYDRTASPALYDADSFDEVLTYGRERGIVIFPMMNLMGRSTLLPRLIPALSACDEKGKPTGYGLCLSSAAARKALAEFLGSFLDRYFEEGVEYFHLGFDDLSDIHPHAEDGAAESVWCKCAKCRKLSHAKLFAQFLQWIVEFLSSKGVGKVVLYSNQLLQGEKLLGADLDALLKEESFSSKVVIDWQGNSKDKAGKGNAAKFKCVESWLGPVGNRGSYACYSSDLKAVDGAAASAVKEESDGVLVRGQFDPAFLEQLAMLGVRCWENPDWKEDTLEALRRRWADLEWGNCSEQYLSALDELRKLSEDELNQIGLPWNYLMVCADPKKPFLPAYPADALAALEARKATAAKMQKLAESASVLAESVASIMGGNHWNETQGASLQSILANAQRIRFQAEFFGTLLKIKAALAKKSGGKAEACKVLDEALAEMLSLLKGIEENMPDCLLWIVMQQLGAQKLYLEKLLETLKKSKTTPKLTWTLPVDWAVPEDK